jgi:hypothetical protein
MGDEGDIVSPGSSVQCASSGTMVVKSPHGTFLHHHDADLSLPLTLAVESALAGGFRTRAAREAGLAASAHRPPNASLMTSMKSRPASRTGER